MPIQRPGRDRSFIRDIPRRPRRHGDRRSHHQPATSLKIGIIAEGVETDEQRTFLLARGCRAMQGLSLAHPESPEAFEAARRLGVRQRPAVSGFAFSMVD